MISNDTLYILTLAVRYPKKANKSIYRNKIFYICDNIFL